MAALFRTWSNINLVAMGLIKFVLSVFWFVLTLGVLVRIWRNHSDSGVNKVLWTLGILLFPFLGPVVWLFYGKRN